jgi:type IV pilus assembly protein PilE
MNKGFTLIELLVVVLIIGILAAVAFPKYQIAVLKSKAAAAMPMLKTINDAEQRYFLTTGNYTTNFNDLDITVGNDCANSCTINNSWFQINSSDVAARLTGSFTLSDFAIAVMVNEAGTIATQMGGIKKGTIVCYSGPQNKNEKVCLALGGRNMVNLGGSLGNTYVLN